MALKILKTIRNNWKKSVFFSGVLYLGVDYLNTINNVNKLMKKYCEDALKYGNETVNVYSQPRHLTVILNPLANDRKCKQYYNDYVAPILHCAGIRVSLIETESQGQAVKLMEEMNNTDGVIIAGGNGTIHEAITGLLRRADTNLISKKMPIGVLPLGSKNDTCYQLLKPDEFLNGNEAKKLKTAKLLAESAIRIVKGAQTEASLLEAHVKNTNKSVYALNNFEFGNLTNISLSSSKYWYFSNFLSKYISIYKNTLFKSLESFEIVPKQTLQFTKVCSGCSKCYQDWITDDIKQAKIKNNGWFSSFRSYNDKKIDHQKIALEKNLKPQSMMNVVFGKN